MPHDFRTCLFLLAAAAVLEWGKASAVAQERAQSPGAAVGETRRREASTAGASASVAPSAVERPKRNDSEVIPIFLAPPTSLEDFWRKLDQPDFVLLSGATYQSLVARPGAEAAPAGNSRVMISSIAVKGKVERDLARLSLELVLTAEDAERRWVPIGLSGLAAITQARESSIDRALRVAAGGGWEVELTRAGRHELTIEALARVAQAGDERRLALPIPICSSTSLDIEIDHPISDAVVGVAESIGTVPGSVPGSTRLRGSLTPRDRIELSWRAEAGALAQLPALFEAEGEIAIEVDPDAMQSRATWQVRAIRGSSRELVFGIDPGEELLGVELDGRVLTSDAARRIDTGKLGLTLDEPLRSGASRRVSFTTRRKLAGTGPNRMRIAGYPLEKAQIQKGALAIYKRRPVYLDGVIGRALRRVDPRTELPEQLRSRPGTVLAYQFSDQPFELGLQIDPAPARIRVEPRSTVVVGADRVEVDTWLDYNITRGEVFDVEVEIDPGLELDAWGPPEVVSGAEYFRDPVPAAGAVDRPTRLILHLTPEAREAGSFRVHLTGRRLTGAGPTAAVRLFRPRGETPLGELVALAGAPGVEASLAARTGTASESAPGFAVLNPAQPPADWIWPASASPEVRAAAVWLRSADAAGRLTVNVARLERILDHETSISVDVQRGRLEMVQESTVTIPFGTIRKLDLLVPPEIADFSVEAPTLQGNDLLAVEPDGSRRRRLTFERETADVVRLRGRYAVPLDLPDGRGTAPIPGLRLLDVRSGSTRIRVGSQTGLAVRLDAEGWRDEVVDDTIDARGRERFLLVREHDSAAWPRCEVRAEPILPMPGSIASRVLLRSTLAADGLLLTRARLALETRGSSIDVALPAGSTWVRAAVDGRSVEEIESLAVADRYRILLPAASRSSSADLTLEYRSPYSDRRGFEPPVLVGGLVGQTYWEIRLPWNRLAIGVPRGWNDENTWEWDAYVWKRRPSISTRALVDWVPATSQVALEESGPGDTDHGYLFSRVGRPESMRLTIHSKAWILVICTGVVALLGVVAVQFRMPARVITAVAAAAVLAVISIWDANVAFTLLQSSSIGIILAISAGLLQWVVDRRRGRGIRTSDRRGSTLLPVPPPSTPRDLVDAIGLGTDDSTTVRKRSGSTNGVGAAPAEPDDQIVILAPSSGSRPPGSDRETSTTAPIAPL
ncbi:MAG: hypothetical protein SFX72_07455 [Isosphaeraceae bacterium]|nr:hypothetical protein [Isosphaeraceae bacterium]